MWLRCGNARFAFSCVMFLVLAVLLTPSAAAQQEPQREIFPPAAGRGAIVVVVSGASGMPAYRDFCSKLAATGYFTVLMDGKDVFDMFAPQSEKSEANLRKVIAESQSADQAVPGKVALVGLSLGGAGVLLQGAAMPEQVSAVVAYYPAIKVLGIDEAVLASRLRSPILVLAPEKDERFESMRALAAAPKAVPFEMAVYPDAGHGFNLRVPQFVHAADADADAWARTVAFLARLHPAQGR